MKSNGGGSDDESSAEVTPEFLQDGLRTTIIEFADYVRAITKDLEDGETEHIEAMAKKGKQVKNVLWRDATFKVDFFKGLLMNLFSSERLVKYYIVLLLPMKPWLKKRKEDFFIKAKLFPRASEDDTKFFRNLWSIEGTMTKEEKDIIWEYWDTLSEIADDWQELTGWTPQPEDKLEIPDINFKKAAEEAGVHLSDEE